MFNSTFIDKKHNGIGNGTLKKIVTDTTQLPYLYTFIHLKLKLKDFVLLHIEDYIPWFKDSIYWMIIYHLGYFKKNG